MISKAMTHLDAELKNLKDAILEMMSLGIVQLEKSKWAFIAQDTELAEEIIHNEKRMNALELSIDRKCENILALFNPVATDLRFVISMLKINSDIERIGDYGHGIAKYVVKMDEPITKQALEKSELPKMFDIAISMMLDIHTAYENDDTALARKVYKKDVELNVIHEVASNTVVEEIKGKAEDIHALLFMFSTMGKLERAGDHIKNVAEDIIFHLDAEVLKHKKKK